MNRRLQFRDKQLIFDGTKVMGILNLTTDSFYDKSRTVDYQILVEKAGEMLEAGADILDLGAYSSRPGAQEVPIDLEIERIKNGVMAIRTAYPNCIISVDTFRSSVAEAALKEGADLINDISSGELDQDLPKVVAEYGVPYIIMHMRGKPENMQTLTNYDDVSKEVRLWLKHKVDSLRSIGIRDIVVDPGIGFAKTVDQNFEIISQVDDLKLLDCPILFGISRKSFIQKTLDTTSEKALNGTTALHSFLINKGVDILRVHDVTEAKETVLLLEKLSKLSKKAF